MSKNPAGTLAVPTVFRRFSFGEAVVGSMDERRKCSLPIKLDMKVIS